MERSKFARNTILVSIVLALGLILVQPFKLLKEAKQSQRAFDQFEEALELPEFLKAPEHINKPIIVFEDKALDSPIKWTNVKGAQRYLIEIYLDESMEEKLHTEQLRSTNYTWSQIFPGRYYYRVRGIDQFDRPGNPSELMSFDILPRIEETQEFLKQSELDFALEEPELVVDGALEKIQTKRTVARIERQKREAEIKRKKTLQARLEEQKRKAIERQEDALRRRSRRRVANVPKLPTTLGQYTVLSKELSRTLTFALGVNSYSVKTDSADTSPQSTTFRLAYSKDKNPHLYQGLIKVGVLKDNSESSTEWSIEGQYAYTLLRLENLDKSPKLTAQTLAGVEVTNPGATNLLGQRELAKAGARINYHASQALKMGAEAAYGMGLTQSLTQSEVSLDARYRINSNYNVGLGFKDKRLTSKDSSANPANSSNYEENSQETFGTFQYNF